MEKLPCGKFFPSFSSHFLWPSGLFVLYSWLMSSEVCVLEESSVGWSLTARSGYLVISDVLMLYKANFACTPVCAASVLWQKLSAR